MLQAPVVGTFSFEKVQLISGWFTPIAYQILKYLLEEFTSDGTKELRNGYN